MKNTIITLSLAGLLGMSQVGFAAEKQDTNQAVQQQYAQLVESGKSYKDAYQQLAYEIAYESASVQAKQPCRKMIRGL